VLAYFTKTVANMNHKFQDFENGPSPCKTYCNGTSPSAIMFWQGPHWQLPFLLPCGAHWVHIRRNKFGANLVALLTDKVPDTPTTKRHIRGLCSRPESFGGFQTILESKDINTMQTRRKAWMAVNRHRYRVNVSDWGATHGGLLHQMRLEDKMRAHFLIIAQFSS